MKIGRVIGSILAALLFFIGMGVYTLHASLKDMVSEQLIGSTIDELITTAISTNTDTILDKVPVEIEDQVPADIIDNLPEGTKSKIDDVKEEIASDPQVKALTQKYMDAIIAGSTGQTIEAPNINADIEEIVGSNLPKIADAVGREYTQEQVSEIAKEITSKVDAQALFEKGVEKVQSVITPQQQKMLSSISFIQSTNCMIFALALMASSILLMGFVKKSIYKWMPTIGVMSMIGGVLVLLGSSVARMLINNIMQDMPSIFTTASEGVISSVYQCGFYFLIFGISITAVYFIINFITKKVVYE